MISFPQKLPHVLWQERRLVPLSEGWIIESIEHSAKLAGYEHWDLAPHLAKALVIYLEEKCGSNTITVAKLRELIQVSLTGVGYDEVAEQSIVIPPRVSIYLPELANRAAYEIIFFPMLSDRIREALGYQVQGVKLVGLRDCAKILDAAAKWRMTCQHLSEQIISFSRACLLQSASPSVELLIC